MLLILYNVISLLRSTVHSNTLIIRQLSLYRNSIDDFCACMEWAKIKWWFPTFYTIFGSSSSWRSQWKKAFTIAQCGIIVNMAILMKNYQERLAIPHIDSFRPNKQKTKFFHLLKVFTHPLRLNAKKINHWSHIWPDAGHNHGDAMANRRLVF